MAESRLKVVIETTGQGKLKSARKDSDQLAKALGKVGVQSKSAANGIRLTGRAAAGASRGVKGLTATVGQLAIALGGIATAANVFNTAINREESERRIKLVAAAYGEAAGLAEAAGRAAQKFGLGQTEANLAIADTFARLKPLGTSLKDIESVYSGFNTAVKLSGVTAEEAQSAFRQLNQALGSGVLRGDEFTRISEAIPSILITIADELGVTIGELKQLGSDGKLTSQVVVRALKRIEKEGADKVAESLKGPRQQLINLKNAGEDLASELGKFLLPAFIELVKKTTELAKELNKVFETMNKLPKPIKDVAAAFTLLGIAIAGIGLASGIGAAGIIAKIGVAAKGVVPLLAKLGGGAKTVATGWTVAGGAVTKTATAITGATVALGALKAALAIGTFIAWGKIIFDINAEIRETNRLLKGGTEVLDDLEQKIIDTQRAINEASRETGFWEGILNEFVLGVGNADGALAGLNKRLDEFIKKRQQLRVFQGATTSRVRGNSAGYNQRLENTKAELAKQGYTLDASGNVVPLPKVDLGGGSAASSKPEFPNADKFSRIFGEGQALDDALTASRDIRQELERAFQLDTASSDLARRKLEIEFDRLDTQKRINTEAEKGDRLGLKALNDRNAAFQKALAISESLLPVLEEGVQLDKELTEQTGKLQAVWSGVGREVNNVLDALITGTEDWNDVLKNTLQSLSKLLLQAGLSAIGSSAPKGSFLNLLFGGGKAAGGPVSGGTSYLVGEKGPELFTPSSSGNITPNDALGGNTVVNITVNDNGGGSASSSGPNSQQAAQLARLIESSTLAIINREKRPGGTLSLSR